MTLRIPEKHGLTGEKGLAAITTKEDIPVTQKKARDGERIDEPQVESWKTTKNKLQGEEHSRLGDQREQRERKKETAWD